MSESKAREAEGVRSGLIIPGKPPAACGNCLFSAPVPNDLTVVQCRGAPPTPAIVGMGAQGPQIALLRPHVERSMPACALWRERVPQAEMGRAS